MAEGDIGSVIETLEYDNVESDEPAIVHGSGNIYSVAYSGLDSHGWLKTMTISDAGAMALVSGGTLEFDAAGAHYPVMIHVSGNVYAVAYMGGDSDGWIKTFTISDAGAMALVSGGVLEWDTIRAVQVEIIHIAGNVYAIAYQGPDADGWIKTITISAAGAIALVSGGSLEFDTVQCLSVDIVHVSGEVYAIAYQGDGGDGWLKTVTISAAGAIALVSGGSLEFDTVYCADPSIIHITGDIYAIAYQGPDTDGWLKTVTISNTGAIALVSGGSLEFDTVGSGSPEIIHISGNVFAILFSAGGSTGWVKTVTINNAGAISYIDETGLQLSPGAGGWLHGLHIAGNVYVAVYQGADTDGWASTFDMETIISQYMDMLTMMGVG